MWYVSKTVMAVPRLLVLALLAAGCAVSPPKAKPAAPEPTPAITPAPAPTPALTPAPLPPNTVVLDSGGERESSSRTLADSARAAREQRAHAAPPAHVITDKNIKQYAAKGQITVAAPTKKAAEPETAEKAPVRDEQYWRSRTLEVRLRWRKAADDVKELEQSAAGWRRRFYAENDPYVRSGQVKPEWDRVLDRLEEARADAETAKIELEALLEEGRTAGALPGWLREGVDEEPKEEPEPSNEHKVIDPPKVEPPTVEGFGR
jgi:hypothetical protein